MFILEVAELGLMTVGVFVGAYFWFLQYALSYRTSDDRIGDMAASAYMHDPTNNFDFTKTPPDNGTWNNVVSRGVVTSIPKDSKTGTAQVNLKLPRLDGTTADQRYATFNIVISDEWSPSNPSDFQTLTL